MPLLGNFGYLLHKDKISESQLSAIKQDLEVSPELSSNGYESLQSTKFNVYRESKNILRVPRFYGLENIDNNTSIKFDIIEEIDVEFNGKLKEDINQPRASQQTIKQLKEHGCGILSLPTGYGKTTIALNVLSKMKVKTIIIVHKEFLMNQWIERIKQFLPTASIGIIQGKKIDILNKDVTIVMLQSISMKEYDNKLFKNVGLTIIDETHHICAKVFSNALFKISTKYMLGLSATPYRKDGLTKVLNWFIGDVFYYIERENQKNVIVNTVKLTTEYPKFPMNKVGKVCIPEGVNKLTQMSNRTDMIVNIIMRLIIDSTRSVLILSDRRNHCKELKESIEGNIEKNKINKSCGLYLGGMKQHEMQESEKCDVIIATYSLAHEGLDIPKLDTLLLATPKSDIVQSVGRILRETPGKQNNPLVYDIIDMWSIFEYQYYKRQKFYKKTGFLITDASNECKIFM